MNRLPLAILCGFAALGMPSVSVGSPIVYTPERAGFISREVLTSFVRREGQLHPAQLNALAANRRRAAQGKRGKRGRGGKA